MAQPYELLTVEARQAERALRARKREAWPQTTELQRLLARAAAFNEQLFQGLEDLVVETPAATLAEETERWRAGVRTAVKRSREQALQLETFFTVFYFSINCGSLLSTIITPILREVPLARPLQDFQYQY